MKFPSRIERLWLRVRGDITLAGEPTLRALIKRGLRLGSNCNIQTGVIIDPSHCWHIEIGNNVTLAPRVHILAHDASTKKHLGYTRVGKVKIGDNVFLGAGCIVLPGVTIGANAIIGAGSVVHQDVPENVVAAGNPVRVLGSLEDFLVKHREQMKHLPCFGQEYTQSENVSLEMKQEMNEKLVDGYGYVE
ncbi:MAG: acyltransferase [Chloroflexota bacterium]